VGQDADPRSLASGAELTPRQLIAGAVAGTAIRLSSGYRSDITRREERLRLSFADALAEHDVVDGVQTSPEWRPELPLWPWGADGRTKLGGFDVAVRLNGATDHSLVVELKWTHYGVVNALDDAMWDTFKLAHASSTLDAVDHGLLVYLAPLKAWEKPARFAEFFTDSLVDCRDLIAKHEGIWRWSLQEGSACRPTQLPPFIQTGPIASGGLTIDGEPWELRAALVRANGEPWFDLDPDGMPVTASDEPTVLDWPYPEPGPGMEPDDPGADFRWPTYELEDWPSADLRPDDLPGPTATWSEITWFAAHLDGYERFGSDAVGEMANASVGYWNQHSEIDRTRDLDQLRGCLFFEYRRFHHFGHAPSTADTPYIRALVDAIRQQVEATS
jgi:hypothetical protein